MICPNCHKELANGAKFCGSCGTPITANAAFEAEPVSTAPKTNMVLAMLKGIPPKFLIMGVAAIAVIILAVVLIPMLFGGSREYAFYLKDGEIYYSDYSKKAPFKLTSNLTDDSGFGNSALATRSYLLSVGLSENQKKVLYVDRISGSSMNSVSLYYRDLDDMESESVKIDSGIESYTINGNFSKIVYQKNGDLYISNMKEKDKIASNVASYYASEDLKTVYFTTTDGYERDLYCKRGDEDKEKIATNINGSIAFSKDYKTVYYITEDDSLYKKTIGKEKEKIASDVYGMYGDTNGIYYFEDYNTDLTDFLENDNASVGWTDTYGDYTVNAYAPLYYYNGKETITVSEAARPDVPVSGGDTFALVCQVYDTEAIDKIKLSKVTDAYYNGDYYSRYSAASDLVREELKNNSTYALVRNGQICTFEATSINSCRMNEAGNVLYYMDDYSYSSDSGELYKISIKGKNVGKPELVESDVYDYTLMNNSVICFKDYDYEDNVADMYVDGKCIDYGVQPVFDAVGKEIYYMADYDSSKGDGTLKVYNGKNAKTIADDVSNATRTTDGSLLYVYDYSRISYKGDLYRYQNGKAEMVDSEVIAVLDAYIGAHSQFYYDYYG